MYYNMRQTKLRNAVKIIWVIAVEYLFHIVYIMLLVL